MDGEMPRVIPCYSPHSVGNPYKFTFLEIKIQSFLNVTAKQQDVPLFDFDHISH